MIQEPRLTRQTFRNKTPLRPRSIGRLLTQPQHSRYSSSILLEKLPPIDQTIQQENKGPDDGKLLSILSEIERSTTQESLFEFKINCFKVNDRDKELALTGDINNPQLRRQLSYHVCYHNDIQMKLSRDEPDFTMVLRKHQVKDYLRAKMVDWMLEVFGNYKKTTTHFTYFRAVCLMDLYLKQTTKLILDSDLHLIGVVAMFLATKIEDIYHIPLGDFSSRVTHDKFGQINIKATEADFIETLNYEIIFPTHLNYLHHQFYQCFSLSDDTRLNNILDTATYILKMCVHDYHVTQYSPSTLAAVSLGYAIHEYFGTRLDGMNSSSCEQIYKQQMRFQDTVIAMSHCDQMIYKECFGKVQILINTFSKKYPELRNLEKFG